MWFVSRSPSQSTQTSRNFLPQARPSEILMVGSGLFEAPSNYLHPL